MPRWPCLTAKDSLILFYCFCRVVGLCSIRVSLHSGGIPCAGSGDIASRRGHRTGTQSSKRAHAYAPREYLLLKDRARKENYLPAAHRAADYSAAAIIGPSVEQIGSGDARYQLIPAALG